VSRILQGKSRNSFVGDSLAAAPPKFKFGPSGELGYVVGNTESTNGASLIFFPNKGYHVAFPRVDIQPMHITTAILSKIELAQHMRNLVVTPESISLPDRPLSSSPLAPLPPTTAPVDTAVDESAIPFADLAHSDAVPLNVMSSSDPSDTPLSLEEVSEEDELVVEPPPAEVSDTPDSVPDTMSRPRCYRIRRVIFWSTQPYRLRRVMSRPQLTIPPLLCKRALSTHTTPVTSASRRGCTVPSEHLPTPVLMTLPRWDEH
jgi:hypothetical protein